MKKFKKMLAVALAMVMIVAMNVSVFAAENEFGDGAHTSTPEKTITATGVTAGDSVSYYQLVEWNNGDWALTELGEDCGVTLANLIDGITEAEATTIATNLAEATATGTMTADATDGTTFTAGTNDSPIAAGLYYLKAVPAATNKDTVYNPAFVSADYNEGNNTVSFSDTIGASAVVKKSSVPFDKDVVGTDKYIDTKPGDIIPYTITTQIPSYGTSFEEPEFSINDAFSTGLELKIDAEHPITVTYGSNTTIAASSAVVTNDNVTITPATAGFDVAFSEAYLTGLNGAQPSVTITYFGVVTTEAETNVTAMDNTATLTFSNKPGETVNKTDITRHYTFTIDGDLLGGGGTETSELIKTAVDENGDPIFSETETFYQQDPVNPLAGASFTLTPVDPTTGEAQTVNSDAHGRINFTGLDAGTYTLVENSAPEGYIKDSRTYTVIITPTYDETITDLLLSYTVQFKLGDTVLTTSGFTLSNEGTIKKVTSSADTDASQFIGNTPGAELPSTGGMGTTILYVIGTLLVLGAGILLVTRRRMSAQ